VPADAPTVPEAEPVSTRGPDGVAPAVTDGAAASASADTGPALTEAWTSGGVTLTPELPTETLGSVAEASTAGAWAGAGPAPEPCAAGAPPVSGAVTGATADVTAPTGSSAMAVEDPTASEIAVAASSGTR
jgi:hypothetical protein